MAYDQNDEQKHGHKGVMGKTIPPNDLHEGFSSEDELNVPSENPGSADTGKPLSGTEEKQNDQRTGSQQQENSATDAQL